MAARAALEENLFALLEFLCREVGCPRRHHNVGIDTLHAGWRAHVTHFAFRGTGVAGALPGFVRENRSRRQERRGERRGCRKDEKARLHPKRSDGRLGSTDCRTERRATQ